jgi:hypothetical protein
VVDLTQIKLAADKERLTDEVHELTSQNELLKKLLTENGIS